MAFRLVLWLLTVVVAAVAGVFATSQTYERKLLRMDEERQMYLEIAHRSVDMSEKSFHYASSYQSLLDSCMAKIAPPVTVEIFAQRKFLGSKGGVGGPSDSDVRKPGRLP
jgi:hypothetical protein